jgi:malonate decarboxylase beta subunit
MSTSQGRASISGFHELSPRERLAALLDDGCFTELIGPFDGIHSPWLLQQGLVPQSDDGVVIVRGALDRHDVVGIAIEGGFEGGSIGEVGGAKIASALRLAAKSCRDGHPVAALLLLETGGVRLQEATLGLAAIADIQSTIIELREYAPVVTVIGGPVGCFGGMSLAAELCTYIIGTPHGRLGMNGPEVIEQEAGPNEIDASDRELIWQLVGCEARCRDGWIHAFVPDQAQAISLAIRDGIKRGPYRTGAKMRPVDHLRDLRLKFPKSHSETNSASRVMSRGRNWIEKLSTSQVNEALDTPSILTADVNISGGHGDAFAIAIVPDADSRFLRAAHGELGLEQAWALAACIEEFVETERRAGTRHPILAIVDTPGQAFGRIEEQRCISAAAGAAIEAYAAAMRAGHPVVTLVVGRAVSGAFLAHGFQSDHILAFADKEVSMYAMSAQSIARITRRTVAEVQDAAAATLPMSFDIHDAHRLGVIDELIENICADDPGSEDVVLVRSCLAEAFAAQSRREREDTAFSENSFRKSTLAVREQMRLQWDAVNKADSISTVRA